MQKAPNGTKETILGTAKEILLNGDVADFTIRAVAKRSGVSIGTVYNYYESKDMLAASVMLEDWFSVLDDIRAGCCRAGSLCEALELMHEQLEFFGRKYRSVWAQYRTEGNFAEEYSKRHRQITLQLAECLSEPLKTHWPSHPAQISVFFAENLLLCTAGSCLSFKMLLDIAEHLQNDTTKWEE